MVLLVAVSGFGQQSDMETFKLEDVSLEEGPFRLSLIHI